MKKSFTYCILSTIARLCGGKQQDKIAEYVLNRKLLLKAGRTESGDYVYQGPMEFPSSVETLDWVYNILSVLDTKASALMRLNGVMFAAAALLLKPSGSQDRWIPHLVAISGMGSALSIILCLLVVAVDWPFLGLATRKRPDDEGTIVADFSEEFRHLKLVAHLRQIFYRWAWSVSFLCGLSFLIAAFLFFIHVWINTPPDGQAHTN